MEYKCLNNREEAKKYNYKTAKIKGFKTLSDLGLPNNFYGGRVHRIAELKDDKRLLILDHLNNVIDLLEADEEEVVTVTETNEVVANICEKCGKEFKTPLALGSHKRYCKA